MQRKKGIRDIYFFLRTILLKDQLMSIILFLPCAKLLTNGPLACSCPSLWLWASEAQASAQSTSAYDLVTLGGNFTAHWCLSFLLSDVRRLEWPWHSLLWPRSSLFPSMSSHLHIPCPSDQTLSEMVEDETVRGELILWTPWDSPDVLWPLSRVFQVPKGLPRRLSGEESTRRCRGRVFDPWVQKIPWRRKWQLTPVFLPGELPWTGESRDGDSGAFSVRVTLFTHLQWAWALLAAL